MLFIYMLSKISSDCEPRIQLQFLTLYKIVLNRNRLCQKKNLHWVKQSKFLINLGHENSIDAQQT